MDTWWERMEKENGIIGYLWKLSVQIFEKFPTVFTLPSNISYILPAYPPGLSSTAFLEAP